MTSNQPKILYVTNTIPCPPVQGSHHRVLNIALKLKQLGQLTFLYVGREQDKSRIEATEKQLGKITTMDVTTKKFSGFLGKRIHSFKFHFPWYYADKVSKQNRSEFQKLADQHDIVWFHTLTAADILGVRSIENSVMDLDDLNHIKYRIKQQNDTNAKDRLASRILSYKWKRREMLALKRFTRIVLCSQHDKEILNNPQNVNIVPNGFNPPTNEPTWQPKTQNRLGFMGQLRYGPNAEGIIWFAEKVWPIIKEQIPDATTRVIGQGSDEIDFTKYPGFEPTGFIESTDAEIATWSAMIVPLLYGGGTRLKIVEALSKMCPIVSTKVGAHGLQTANQTDIMLADKAEEFAQACIKLLTRQDTAEKMAKAGYELFKQKYSWQVIGQNISEVINKLT